MPKKKVKLALIPNHAARRNTFNRRKKGMMKMLSELSTLCGITTCAVIFGPFDQQPDFWPSPEEAKRLFNMFKNMPVIERCKKILSNEDFLCQRITKIKDQYEKVQKENRRKEMMMLMSDCFKGKDLDDLTMPDLTDLAYVIDEKMKAIDERIEAIKQISPPDQIGTKEDTTTPLQVAAVNDVQGQPWFIHGMNLNQLPMPCFGNEVVLPYVDNPAWKAP